MGGDSHPSTANKHTTNHCVLRHPGPDMPEVVTSVTPLLTSSTTKHYMLRHPGHDMPGVVTTVTPLLTSSTTKHYMLRHPGHYMPWVGDNRHSTARQAGIQGITCRGVDLRSTSRHTAQASRQTAQASRALDAVGLTSGPPPGIQPRHPGIQPRHPEHYMPWG